MIEKIKKNINTNNWEKKIVVLAVLIAIFVIFLIRVRQLYIIPVLQREPDLAIKTEGTDVESLNNNKISQTFKATYDGISAINLMFVKENAINNKNYTINVALYEGQELIQNWNVQEDKLYLGEWTKFSLDKELVGVADKIYRIEIDVTGNCNIAMYVTNSDSYLEGTYMKNDVEYNKDLVIGIAGSGYKFLNLASWIIGMLFICFLTVVSGYIIFAKKIKIEKVFLISSIGLGIIYGILLPPFSTPDESAHFTASVHLAKKIEGNYKQGKVEQEPIVNDNNFNRTVDINVYKKVYNAMNCSSREFLSFYENQYDYVGKNKILSLEQMMSTLGILVSKVFRLNYIYTVYLARFLNLIFYSILGYFAIKIMPFGKIILMFTATLPMMMELACSVSYDVWIDSCLFLYVAYVFYLSYKKTEITMKDIILAVLLVILGSKQKPVYFPMILLLFMIPKKIIITNDLLLKLQNSKIYQAVVTFVKKYKKIFIIGGMTISCIGVLAYYIYCKDMDSQNALLPENCYGIHHIVANPFQTIEHLTNTIIVKADSYLNTMVGQSLGCFNVTVEHIYIYIFLLLLFISAFLEQKKFNIRKKDKFIISIVVISVMVFVIIAMYAYSTLTIYDWVEGVQGRYFIAIVPLVILLLKNIPLKVTKNIDKHLTLSWLCVHYFVVLNIISYCIRVGL